MGFPAEERTDATLTHLLDFGTQELRARLGWGEFVLVEQIHVAFGPISFVALVGFTMDTGEVAGSHSCYMRMWYL